MGCTRRTCELIARSISACELDGQAFSVEVRAVFDQVLLLSRIEGSFRNLRMAAQWISDVYKYGQEKPKLTRHHVPSIQRIIVLDEPEAVHQLDFGDVASSILGEVGLDVFLGDCNKVLNVSDSVAMCTPEELWIDCDAP